MSSLIEALAGRVVGVVESVSTDVINVRVDSFAPHTTALNTGTPIGFPRINGYLLIPNKSGATICVITSVRIDRLPYPKSKRVQDAYLVDLPFPTRLTTLTPLGTLTSTQHDKFGGQGFKLHRGVDVFPSIGDPVLLPTDMQLQAVVEGESSDHSGQICIGRCPTAEGAPIRVNPDKLFGRHLAVLGNTGAGKSCTVAGLIRWSLEAAKSTCNGNKPNARFIILDPNGEYAKAFNDLTPQVFQVEGSDTSKALKVPAWLWNGDEWSAFTSAAPGVQRPILFDAIRKLRSNPGSPSANLNLNIQLCVESSSNQILNAIRSNKTPTPGLLQNFAQLLENLANELTDFSEKAKDPLQSALREAADVSREVEESARGGQKNGNTPKGIQVLARNRWHNVFPNSDLKRILACLKIIKQHVGSASKNLAASENTPVPFCVDELPDFVAKLAANVEGRDVAQFVDSLKLRINSLFVKGPLRSITDPDNSSSLTLEGWLENYLGTSQNVNNSLSIVDLSLVPSEVVHVVVAVLARMLFEATQRHKKLTKSELPTVLVLDEAHTFVRQELTSESSTGAGQTCCRTFERIAREGRKFGFGLVLASQRPSDISPTVLSQCNTFLLHRIVNDQDRNLVKSLVPDGLGDLLRELPSLPSKRAILLGWGAPVPLLTEVRELDKKHRPDSQDPAFWNTWIGVKECETDWSTVSEQWVESPKLTPEVPSQNAVDPPQE